MVQVNRPARGQGIIDWTYQAYRLVVGSLAIILGLLAPSAGRAAGAWIASGLEQEYVQAPRPELLCKLGEAAQKEGRPAAAIDLLWRCVQETVDGIPSARRTEIVARWEQRGPGGELSVSGESNAVVRVDGRVVAVLPLSRPLWLAAGPHLVDVQPRGRAAGRAIDCDIEEGRPYLLQRDEIGQLSCGTTFAVVLLAEANGALLPRLLRTTEDALLREAHVQTVSQERLAVALARNPELGSCLREARCQERLAQLLRAEFMLTLRAGAGRLVGEVYNAEVGEQVLQQMEPCSGCGDEAWLRLSRSAASRWMLQGINQNAGGILKVDARPLSGEVLVDRKQKGSTPFQRRVFSGTHVVVVARKNYVPVQYNTVVVKPNQTVQLSDALLRRVSVRPWTPLKWIGLTMGLAAIGGGVGVLSLTPTPMNCPIPDDSNPRCEQTLSTTKTSLWAFLPGAGMLSASLLFFLLDARDARRERVVREAIGIHE